MSEAFVTNEVNEAIKRATVPLLPWWTHYSSIIEVVAPAAGTKFGVPHGLDAIPDGVLVVLEVGGAIRSASPQTWNREEAFLVGDRAGARARVMFFTKRLPFQRYGSDLFPGGVPPAPPTGGEPGPIGPPGPEGPMGPQGPQGEPGSGATLPTAPLDQVLISQGVGVQPIFSPDPRVTTISLGSNPAQSGAVRLANGNQIFWRGADGTTDAGYIKLEGWLEIVNYDQAIWIQGKQSVYLNAETAAPILLAYQAFYPNSDATVSLGYNAAGGRWKAAYVRDAFVVGDNPAQSGALRLANDQSIVYRNVANDADITLARLNINNQLLLGGNATGIYIDSAADIALRAHGGGASVYIGAAFVYPSVNLALSLGYPSNRFRDLNVDGLTLTARVATFDLAPVAPTLPPGTSTTQLATTEFVTDAIGGGGGGGMNLDYLGDFAAGPTYNDGDIVIGADGVAYMCVVDGTTTPPEPWPGTGVAVNATVDASYWVVNGHAALTNERVMSALANGYVKSTAGEPSTVAIIPVADGGTGASTPAVARTNLGAAPLDATYWVVSAHTGLSNERALAALATGYVKSTAGEPSTVAIIPITDGGTGASTAPTARTNLGVGTVGTLNLNGDAATYLNGAGSWTTPQGVPTGAIILFTGACPPGYSRVAGWDGYYLRFGAAYGSGGATSHSHGTGTLAAPAHTHTDGTYAAANHTHASGTLAVASHTHGSVSISGNTSSDGGHAHSIELTTGNDNKGTMNCDAGGSGVMSRGDHQHSIAGTSATTPSHNHSFSGSGATGSASPDVTGDTAAENADVTGVSGPASATALTGALATAANDPLYVQLVACQKD